MWSWNQTELDTKSSRASDEIKSDFKWNQINRASNSIKYGNKEWRRNTEKFYTERFTEKVLHRGNSKNFTSFKEEVLQILQGKFCKGTTQKNRGMTQEIRTMPEKIKRKSDIKFIQL